MAKNMTNSYEERYSRYYDLLYRDKDYEAECNFIEAIFNKFSSIPVDTVLELGCGTGGHAIHLAKEHRVTGIDRSEAMIGRAKEKGVGNPNLDFRIMDIRQAELNRKFDACIAMFAVMNYITSTKDILETLVKVRQHLKKGSVFTFDFWNGLAVLRILPSARVKEVEDRGIRLIRTVEPELNAIEHLCDVHYHLLVIQDDNLLEEFKETHTVRYFFPQEITHYLEDCGFEVLKICPFLDLDRKADENVWNITAIARVV
ncbi:methyltransferase domain-containing protein [Chloroflexota bacterium]